MRGVRRNGRKCGPEGGRPGTHEKNAPGHDTRGVEKDLENQLGDLRPSKRSPETFGVP
ncbi:hypothetical protein HMPREF9440_01770 [Sutterella parvirubra YIT 11816]|uniref:Uncharacterized protein n=1 Tax=Sutterella parvirubra YIT 11816 TaxID=762967 RepID=H3KG91_9BURK|nr:hypothetical protein HMPREF9440_01770 [Sutterella parvirubra YIT 11816]